MLYAKNILNLPVMFYKNIVHKVIFIVTYLIIFIIKW